MPMAEYNAMIMKCRQATRRQSRLTSCTEVIAVSAVVTDTAVERAIRVRWQTAVR